MIRLAQAASDENYKEEGRVPGDQRQGEIMPDGTQDGEVNIVLWWDYEWDFMFRPIDPQVAETMCTVVEDSAHNRNVGYSQPRHMTYYNALVEAGFDAKKITTPCGTHCAAIMAAAGRAAGLKINPSMYTGNARAALMNTGAFTEFSDPAYLRKPDNLKRGDILLKRHNGEGHMAIVLDDARELKTEPYIVTGNNLRLRTEPDTSKKNTIAYMTMGETFNVFSFTTADDGSSWAQGEYHGKTGYASMQYLAPEQTPDGDGEDDVIYIVTASVSARIREKPGKALANPTLAWPKRGQEVFGLGPMEDVDGTTWINVAFYDVVGWISSKMVQVK